MSLAAVMTSPQFLGALLLYALTVLLCERVASRLAPHMAQHGLTDWLLEHVYVPLSRAACIVLFVAAAYPLLFGTVQAPWLFEVLGDGERRVSTLLNLAFIASLLLPLIPVLGDRLALVLPLQAIATSALLLHWTAASAGAHVSLWPGSDVVLVLLVLVALGEPLARATARFWAMVRAEREEPWIAETALLMLQVPVILTYTLHVGAPLAGPAAMH
ncbi:MAG: hypothetical protein WDA11_07950 [Thiohalomonadaceae bacterium]